MADKVAMDPQELRSRAAQVRGFVTEHEDVMRRLTNLIIDIDEVWNGDAQTAYVNRFRASRHLLERFEQRMLKYAQDMELSADRIESTDHELALMIAKIG